MPREICQNVESDRWKSFRFNDVLHFELIEGGFDGADVVRQYARCIFFRQYAELFQRNIPQGKMVAVYQGRHLPLIIVSEDQIENDRQIEIRNMLGRGREAPYF